MDWRWLDEAALHAAIRSGESAAESARGDHPYRRTLTCGRSDPTLITPRGFAPRTPLHALSRAASPARAVRVARFATLVRVFVREALPVAVLKPLQVVTSHAWICKAPRVSHLPRLRAAGGVHLVRRAVFLVC